MSEESTFSKIASFVKIEHTLFSLPFVFIGAKIAAQQGYPVTITDLLLILIAAIGARGLAMGLNRIIDREIDANNPRTENRHLASGSMSLGTAYKLCAVFLLMLVTSAWMLNPIALYMSWLPVLAFVIYPFMKRFTWACHFWLGLCLGLAPAGAWVAISADSLGWAAITDSSNWYPDVFNTSLAVLLWIAAFDLGYARMDVERARENGIHSFPGTFGESVTNWTTLALTIACVFLLGTIPALLAALPIIFCIIKWNMQWTTWQDYWFKSHVATGWILLGGMLLG